MTTTTETTIQSPKAPKQSKPAASKTKKAAAKAPAKRASAKPAKVASVKKAPASSAPAKNGNGEKGTMTEKLIGLAERKEGVSAAELNKTSGWKGAPWKWSFSNRKGTGWCDKRGLKFWTAQDSDGVLRYHVAAN